MRIIKFSLIFAFLMCCLEVRSNSATFYVVRPPANLSWDSPKSIAWSAIQASLNSSLHSIGHVTTHVECQTLDGERVNFWTGMTSAQDNPTDLELIRNEKLGLGVLFYDFAGHLENKDEIIASLELARNEIARFFSLKFLISEEHCQRMKTYYDGFKQKNVDAYYGLVHRPRYKEGAGCTAYAMSFLDVAGLLTSEIKSKWGKSIRIPASLLGTVENPVSISQLLYSKESSRWAVENENHFPLSFFDTQFMYEWTQEIRKSSSLPSNVSYDQEAYNRWHKVIRVTSRNPGRDSGRLISRSNQFFGLKIDMRHKKAATDPIWKF